MTMIADDTGAPRPVGWVGPAGQTVTDVFTVWVPTNNRPGRGAESATLTAERYTYPQANGSASREMIRLVGALNVVSHARTALWLLDDGQSVTSYFTAGYHETHRYVILDRKVPGIPETTDGPRLTYSMLKTD